MNSIIWIMFDLQYYRELAKKEKFENSLSNAFSRKNVHNIVRRGKQEYDNFMENNSNEMCF